MKGARQAMHPLILCTLAAIGGVFDRQLGYSTALPRGARTHVVATSRNGGRSRNTGIAATRRAARKARNVARNRKAHRG